MLSSTAAQVRIQPRMIHPKYGNTGDDHGASRSRRSTTPRFTALSATIANAIVIEIDAWSVLGLSGPQSRTASARPAMTKPLMSQRIDLGPGDDPACRVRAAAAASRWDRGHRR